MFWVIRGAGDGESHVSYNPAMIMVSIALKAGPTGETSKGGETLRRLVDTGTLDT